MSTSQLIRAIREYVNLSSTGHRRGVVAGPHPAAVAAGREIIAQGGNALEAMVAMAATITVVYPHMNHVGGDGFWLFREPSGRVRAIDAAGPAGALATVEFYRQKNLDQIPTRGPLAALTVPGAIGGWILALEAARSHRGRMPFARLLASAIHAARTGYTVTRSQAALTEAKLGELKDVPGFARAFLLDRQPPPEGAVLKQPALAATLERFADAGPEDFYRGDVGRTVANDLAAIGSPVTRADLESYRAILREPLSLKLGAGTVFNLPPPTQGLASLMILGLFERLSVGAAEGFDHVHGIVEATKRAFRVRDQYITDYERLPYPPDRHLAPAFLDAEALMINRHKEAPWPAPPDAGDTIWMGAADASGLVVSYIQSIYWEFGSGCVLPATGVLMQNRGASFSLDAGAVNPLSPGRRPFHTLNPAIAVLDDRRVMAYGTMGGDGQPQTQAAVYTRYAGFRQSLAEAIDRPRWLLGRTWGSTQSNLRLENRFEPSLIDGLRAAGHDVEVLPESYSDTMGHAGAVVLHPDGTLEGAHDPRADGGADGV